MKTNLKLILGMLLFSSQIFLAQNGKLISSVNALPFSDEDVKLYKEKRYPDFDTAYNNTTLDKIFYESDGLKVSAYVAQPKAPGKYPVIFYCRGGNRTVGSMDITFQQYYIQRIANWGYVVIATNYRGCCGGEGQDEFGGAELNDVFNLIPLLKNYPKADETRIGIHGWSRGGTTSYQALRKSTVFKAAVVCSGNSDSFYDIGNIHKDGFDIETRVYKQLIPNYELNKKEELTKRSATLWANELCKTTPLLIMQGSADERTDAGQTLDFIPKLYKAKQPLKFVLFAGDTHGLKINNTEMEANMKAWFDDYLKDLKPLPNLELR